VSTDDSRNDTGDMTVSLRSGMTVRVVNPRSQHYGNTGHLLGRNEQQEPYWLVRFTTASAPVLLLEEELENVR
jgi:hypothetical protein